MNGLMTRYRWCSSRFPIHGQQIEDLLQTRVMVMAVSDCLSREVDGKAGSGCCRGWLSRTCVQWAQGANWSLDLCTLLKGDRDWCKSLVGLHNVIP